jgi:hypothetical protein
LESITQSSSIIEPELERLKIELAKPENYDSHFYRSHLMQHQALKKVGVDKPQSLIRRFDSLFGHLDEIMQIGSVRISLEKIQIEIQAVSDDLGLIKDKFFDQHDSLDKKETVSGLYDIFYDLNDIFLGIYEVLSGKGLSAFIRPRKEVLDTLAEQNKTRFHRSKIHSPEAISLAYINSVIYQYLGVPNDRLMLPPLNFAHPMSSSFIRTIEAEQKNLFPRLQRDLTEFDFEGLQAKHDLNLDEEDYKLMMRKPKAFNAYVDRELGDLASKASYAELERSVRRLLVLDTIREIKMLKESGFEVNFMNYARRIDEKTSASRQSSFKTALATMKSINPLSKDSVLDDAFSIMAITESGGRKALAKQTRDLYHEAQGSFKEGHFISWDAIKQKDSKDPVLQNLFEYFQENIFILIQDDFQVNKTKVKIEDALDKAFADFSRRGFNSLINQITAEALKKGVSRPDLLQFRYIATRLFKDNREMHGQNTTISGIKRLFAKTTQSLL